MAQIVAQNNHLLIIPMTIDQFKVTGEGVGVGRVNKLDVALASSYSIGDIVMFRDKNTILIAYAGAEFKIVSQADIIAKITNIYEY